jgi:hypothetical protein
MLMKYTELLSRHSDSKKIPYLELLQTEEWRNLRECILKRDSHMCSICGIQAGTEVGLGEHMLERLGMAQRKYCFYNFSTEVNITDFIARFVGRGFTFIVETDWYDEQKERSNFLLVIPQKGFSFQVHHKYYILDNLPWDYALDGFSTMCDHCHFEFHKANEIDFYEKKGNELVLSKRRQGCPRCYGSRYFPEFKHVEHGICFQCHGEGFLI